MPITTVMFDLDGTLLPMDLDAFVKDYFGRLAAKMAPHGYEPKKLMDTIMSGIGSMVKNDGSCSNEDAFWKTAVAMSGQKIADDIDIFTDFYENDFDAVKASCGFAPEAAQIVRGLNARGLRVVLATNPIFPARATMWRIQWAGLEPEDFELVTTYENSRHCKPNPDYYRDILSELGLKGEECVMVGNDVQEDMIAESLGMRVFLLTPCMIDRCGTDISVYPHGGFKELAEFLENI